MGEGQKKNGKQVMNMRTSSQSLWNRILLHPVSSGKESGLWIFILFCIISLRIILEGYLEAFKVLVPFAAYFGNFSYFIVIFLSLLLFLRLGTGKKLPFLLKPIILGFFLIVTVPLVDYIISGGKGYYLAYPNVSPLVILKSFPFIMKDIPGISPGMRIEAVAAMLSMFLFGILGWKIRWWHAIVLSLGIYTVVFLTGLYPGLIGSLSMPPRSVVEYSAPRFYLQTPPMETRWMLLICLEILIMGFLENKDTVLKFFAGVKISRLFFYTMIPLFGILLARKTGHFLMNNVRSLTLTQYGVRSLPVEEIPVRIILTLLSTAFAFIFAQMVNDWYDRETDRINGQPNFFNRGDLSPGIIGLYGTICGIWALASGLSMGWPPFLFIASSIAGSIVYSAKPLRLKRAPFLSSVLVSLICGLLILYGFSFLPNSFFKRLFPQKLVWIILAALPLGLQVKDLKDIEGDRATGIWTVPVLLDRSWGIRVGTLLSIAGFILAAKIMGGLFPMAVASLCSLAIIICVSFKQYAWAANCAILGFALMSGIYLGIGTA